MKTLKQCRKYLSVLGNDASAYIIQYGFVSIKITLKNVDIIITDEHYKNMYLIFTKYSDLAQALLETWNEARLVDQAHAYCLGLHQHKVI